MFQLVRIFFIFHNNAFVLFDIHFNDRNLILIALTQMNVLFDYYVFAGNLTYGFWQVRLILGDPFFAFTWDLIQTRELISWEPLSIHDIRAVLRVSSVIMVLISPRQRIPKRVPCIDRKLLSLSNYNLGPPCLRPVLNLYLPQRWGWFKAFILIILTQRGCHSYVLVQIFVILLLWLVLFNSLGVIIS